MKILLTFLKTNAVSQKRQVMMNKAYEKGRIQYFKKINVSSAKISLKCKESDTETGLHVQSILSNHLKIELFN